MLTRTFHLNTFLTHRKKKKIKLSKSNYKISLLNRSSLNPLIAGLVPCSPSRAQEKNMLFITKGLSVRPSTPLCLAQCLRGLVLHMEEQKFVSWRALTLNMIPDNMSQHVTMITSHSDKKMLIALQYSDIKIRHKSSLLLDKRAQCTSRSEKGDRFRL